MDSSANKTARRRIPVPEMLIALGVLLCLAPLASDMVARHQARQTISELSDSVSAGASNNAELLAQARSYNALLGGQMPELPASEVWPYEDQLATSEGTGAMAWMEAPRANLNLPVYHGADEAVLAQGAGHWQMSSLPVGGHHTHSWLEGHSGMQSSSLFDDIRVLEQGDVVGVHAAGQDLAYRVSGWEIVDPADIQGPQIDSDDQLTLVTCTTIPDALNPKGRVGVNDKRLLVHAQRCDYDPAEFQRASQAAATDIQLVITEHSYQALIALAAVAGLIIFTLVTKAAAHRKAD